MKDKESLENNGQEVRIQELLSCGIQDHLPLDEGPESRLAIEKILKNARESIVAVISGEDIDNWDNRLLGIIPTTINEPMLSVKLILSSAARNKFSEASLSRFGNQVYSLPDFASDVRPFLLVDGKYIRIAKQGKSRSFLVVNDADFGALLTDIGVILTDKMSEEKGKL